MISIYITYKREKGPPTPNFDRLSKILREKAPKMELREDREIVWRQLGGVYVKMKYVCDVIMERLQPPSCELKAGPKGPVMYLEKKEFFDFITTYETYVFELYSILDGFASGLSMILDLKRKCRKVDDFMSLREATNSEPELKRRIDDFAQLPWFKYFHSMRNRVVHDLPINLWSLIKGTNEIEFPLLPDSPRIPNSPSNKKLKPMVESKIWLDGVFSFVDDVSDYVGRKLFDDF